MRLKQLQNRERTCNFSPTQKYIYFILCHIRLVFSDPITSRAINVIIQKEQISCIILILHLNRKYKIETFCQFNISGNIIYIIYIHNYMQITIILILHLNRKYKRDIVSSIFLAI